MKVYKDSLLKMVQNPGGDWHPGWGVISTSLGIQLIGVACGQDSIVGLVKEHMCPSGWLTSRHLGLVVHKDISSRKSGSVRMEIDENLNQIYWSI